MVLQENISLKALNTFGIIATARYFSSFKNAEELQEIITKHATPLSARPLFILGGGSNILLTKNVDGLVLKNDITGIDLVDEDNEYVYVRAGAGENWHQFVLYCLQRNWAGVENLSLIPGNVGAGPMQNIGAYGVELKDVFHELLALRIADGTIQTFSVNDCRFGYRESIFKGEYKNAYVILQVVFRLHKHAVLHTSYGAISQELEKMGIAVPDIRTVSRAVINIRMAKLPDPAVVGNAGSFFKNPLVEDQAFEQLKKDFPGIIGYPVDGGGVKLAAGWLIEQCGWKGFRRGDAGCHDKQALVLVNYGQATGAEIVELGEEIRVSVNRRFGVTLEREVNLV